MTTPATGMTTIVIHDANRSRNVRFTGRMIYDSRRLGFIGHTVYLTRHGRIAFHEDGLRLAVFENFADFADRYGRAGGHARELISAVAATLGGSDVVDLDI